jgi:hypothetical protein
MTVEMIEHRAQRVRCPECGGRARGELPNEVTSSVFGPRLQAAVAALSVRNRVSRRDVVELAEELFSARISTGTVDAILARASSALAEPYGDLPKCIRRARALNVDETGWRTAGERRALWGAQRNSSSNHWRLTQDSWLRRKRTHPGQIGRADARADTDGCEGGP